MALINCPNCNKQISDQAEMCPGCGYKLNTAVTDDGTRNDSSSKVNFPEKQDDYIVERRLKRFVCEMCESSDLVKQDGFYVCQSCGTKYTIEEAKKMMTDGSVDVSGSKIKVDNTENIDKYYNMAQNAYDADNKREAEEYCNKILEIDNNHYKAWLIKGKAAGWQSTIAKLRIDEAINCFSKAVDNAPQDEVEELKKHVASETNALCAALISLCCKNFMSLPSKDNADNIIGAALLMKRVSLSLLSKCGAKTSDISKLLASSISSTAITSWNNTVLPEYSGDDHPSKFVWERFIERGDAILSLVKIAISLCDDDDEEDYKRYKNMITIQENLIKSASYKYYSQVGWGKEFVLNDESKSRRRNEIMEWHKKCNAINSEHVIPSVESINNSTTQNDNSAAVLCIILIIVIVAIISGFM